MGNLSSLCCQQQNLSLRGLCHLQKAVVVGQEETPTQKRHLGETEIFHHGRHEKLGIHRRSGRWGGTPETGLYEISLRCENPTAYPYPGRSKPLRPAMGSVF